MLHTGAPFDWPLGAVHFILHVLCFTSCEQRVPGHALRQTCYFVLIVISTEVRSLCLYINLLFLAVS